MGDYTCLSEKNRAFNGSHTINFIERNIEGITQEEVDKYNFVLGKLFRWMNLAIKTRKEDIIRRKTKEKREKEERKQ